jgi:ABC-2 type transport system ATP-binding protein
MITVQNMSKRYGDVVAVDDVSFSVAPGRVTGFLGPNGAGKSTVMRMIAGLTRPSAGTATVLGSPYVDLVNPGRHAGLLLDASAQHPGRTGHEVLAIGAMTMGLPRSRVAQVLDAVGLSRREGSRLVRHYSLGMRQRLGIGHALLGDPRVLVLDEPANGLDPAGIRWMRDLLADFAAGGGTVLLSSHLIAEVERIADDIIVIGHGRILSQGPATQLLTSAHTVVDATEPSALAAALRHFGLSHSPAPAGGFLVEAEAPRVGAVASAAGLTLVELRRADGGSLEQIFLAMTATTARQEASA